MSFTRFDREEFHTYQHQPLAPIPFLLAGSGRYLHVRQACNPTRKGALRGRYVHSKADSMLGQELEIRSTSTGLTHVAPKPETPEPTTATFMYVLVIHDGEKEEKVCHGTCYF